MLSTKCQCTYISVMHGLNHNVIKSFLIAFIILESVVSWSQEFDNWSVGIQGGLSSYYGDLSRQDSNPIKKLSDESNRYFGLEVVKRVSPACKLSATFTDHKLAGSNPYQKYSFNSRFKEALVSADVSVLKLFWPTSGDRFDLYGKGGAGMFFYDSFEIISDNTSEDSKPLTEEPETEKSGFVVSCGFGSSYQITNHLKIALEFAGRISSSDLLDGFEGTSGVNDFYSTLGIGVYYTFHRKTTSSNYYQPGSHEYRRFKRDDKGKRYNFRNSD